MLRHYLDTIQTSAEKLQVKFELLELPSEEVSQEASLEDQK